MLTYLLIALVFAFVLVDHADLVRTRKAQAALQTQLEQHEKLQSHYAALAQSSPLTNLPERVTAARR